MAFTTNNRVFIIMLLALLVQAATTLAHKKGDDHAMPSLHESLQNPLWPSPEGSASAKPDGVVDLGLCAVECGVKCFGHGKASTISSPEKFSLGKIWKKFGKICMAKCMLECALDQVNVKPELYHCTLGCAYKSAAETKPIGSDAQRGNNYLGSCYDKCEESHRG